MKVQLLFGRLVQWGCLAIAVGSLFAWPFVAQADLSAWTWPSKLQTAEGELVRRASTHASVNEGAVAELHFRFRHEGVEHQGVSYSERLEGADGALVAVEFPPGRPELARIQGARRDVFPAAAVLAAVPLGLALLFTVGAMLAARRRLRLVEEGEVAEAVYLGGRLAPRSPFVTPGLLVRYLHRFELVVGGEARQVTVRTSDEASPARTGPAHVVYDPESPSRHVVLCALAGEARLSEDGRVVHADPPPTSLYLAAPVSLVLANAVVALLVAVL